MDVARLREQAEALIASDNHAFPGADILDLLDEFEAYQVTLDTQRAELQLARAKIESLQRRFEDLYMFTPVSYLVIDADGQIKFANLATYQLLDMHQQALIGNLFSKFLHPQSQSDFHKLLADAYDDALPQQGRFTLVVQSDIIRNVYVAARLQTYYEDDHRLARLALTDITEQVKAEERRVENIDQYHIMFETSHSIKLLIDPDTGDIVDANQAACEFYGYDKLTLTEMRITDINQFTPAQVKQEMQKAVAEQRKYFNFRHQLANGDTRDVEVFSGPINYRGRTLLYSIIHDVTEQKAKEAEHRLLWQAVDQSASSVVITDTSGKIEYVNPSFTKSTGYALTEVMGKSPRILKSGHTSDEEYARLWDTISSGQQWTGEFHNKKKSGELFWERATISPVTNANGEITHYIGIKEDITTEKQALEQLEQKEYALRRSQSIAKIGDWVWDLRTNKLRLSDEMHRIFGLNPSTFTHDLSVIIDDVIHPDDRERVRATNVAFMGNQLPESLEYRIIIPDGTIRHIWSQPGEVTTDERGNVITVSGIIQDVTERNAVLEELKRKEAMLRHSQAIARIGAWKWDLLADTIEWDDEMYSSLGIEDDSFSGSTMDVIEQIVHPDDRERVLAAIPEALMSGSTDGVEYRILQPDGSVRHIWWLPGERDYDADGNMIAVSGIVQDVTERKKAEIRAREAERFSRSTVNALSAHIAILDENGTILAVNDAWLRFAAQNGGTSDAIGVGVNYLQVLRAIDLRSEDAQTANAVVQAINQVISQDIDSFEMEYPCHSPDENRWFVLRVTRFTEDGPTRVVVAHENITERVLATQAVERQKQELSERVKELNGLYNLARLLEQPGISLDEIYQGTVDLIPAACQYPEIVHVRLKIADGMYLTDGFHDSEWTLASPIIVNDQQIGLLEVCYVEEKPTEYKGPFLKEEYALIDEIARRLAQKIKERRDEEQLRLEAETQATILRLLNSDTPDQDSFIELALEEAVKLTNSKIGYFHFVNRDEVSLNLFKWSKGVMEYCTAATESHYPLQQAGIWADCVRTHQPVVHNDYANLQNKQGLPGGHFPLIRHMSVPIMDGDTPVAVLGVGNKSREYSKLDVVRLTLMSTTLWNWIERKRAATEITRQNDEIRAINRAILISTSTLDTETIANIACRELASALGAASVVLATRDNLSGDYHLMAATYTQVGQEAQQDMLVAYADEPILIPLAKYGIPLVANTSTSTRFVQVTFATHMLNNLVIPVKIQTSLFGMFCVGFEADHVFSDRNLGYAANIVQVIAQALENSLLHNEIAEHNDQLSELVSYRTAELSRMNERLNVVLNNVSNPILLIDSSGAIDITNPAFNRKLGYNPDELFGQPLTKIFEVEMRSKIESLLDTVKDTSHAPSFETSVITKSSTLLDVEVSLAFVEADTGYVVCTLYDISHLKEIERMKDQFVSMVSHELRTPITSMLLSSSTLRKYYDRLEDERKVRKITQINEQAELLAELVESILDISRLDARQEPSKYDHVDVAEALATVAEEMRGQAEQKEQHINLEIMTTHAIVRGEKPDFIRIWHNLLSNAVKYTQNGGEIVARIFVSRDFDRSDLLNSVNFTDPIPDDLMTSNYLIGMVEDNGFGMREADIPQLFTRFFRGWAAGSTITGTGLGLSLVRDLLNLYGGDIAVHSELGTGTTFCLWLPIEESDNEHLHSEGNKS